jgi:hypothetical protein
MIPVNEAQQNFFELSFDPEDILSELGYGFSRAALQIPQGSPFPFPSSVLIPDPIPLQQSISQNLTFVDLTSETARREVIIAPILLELCRLTHSKLKIEYPIAVNDQLKGTLDYYIQSQQALLVVEAKNADLSRGFTQLAVELIALDQWTTLEVSVLYGAVTTGDIWKFGKLHRQQRQIEQDINLYRVPADLGELMEILMGILTAT